VFDHGGVAAAAPPSEKRDIIEMSESWIMGVASISLRVAAFEEDETTSIESSCEGTDITGVFIASRRRMGT